MGQARTERGSEHPVQWREDALPEGVGVQPEGGGGGPVRQAEEPDTHPAQAVAVPLLALIAVLAVLSVPGLWALGYLLTGAPGTRLVWPVAVTALLVAGAIAGYWLARRSTRSAP